MWILNAAGGLAAVLLLLSIGSADAAPRRLDCNLTNVETKTGSQSDFEPEKRSISIVFDAQAKALRVYQDGGALALSNVTTTVTSMNGYVDGLSLGINSADWNIVLQTYETDSTRAEFGACRISTEALP
ncbi:hypothetical protein [Bradyrhizobium sp.]|uniref:hypothetical protein n=1 Tax=Bradyrhizobium sp. TaxID=376 RepID=UPI003C6BB16D